MGLKRAFKKAIIKKSMDKRKKQNPFDAEYSDNYSLPSNASSEQNNSHYFSIHNLKTCESIYLRLGLRGFDARNEVWLVYRNIEGKVFVCANDHLEKGQELPIDIKIIKAGDKIEFSFKGKVVEAEKTDSGFYKATTIEHNIDLKADFRARTDIFESSRHMSSNPVARALADEKWTKQFISALKENHQVHYEQSGLSSGTLKLDGEEKSFTDWQIFRDHSYGKRDWGYFDRHIWIVGLLENGDFFHTSLVKYPAVRNLQTGFYKRNGKTVCVDSVSSFEAFPKNGVFKTLEFDVLYENGERKKIKADLEFTIPFVFGNGAYTIFEGVSAFEVDGIKGRGITEFGYNKDKSRY